jgi:hypothetical protein
VAKHTPEAHDSVRLKGSGMESMVYFLISTSYMTSLWPSPLACLAIYEGIRWQCGNLPATLLNEEDYMALRIMYQAGYDLERSLDFWITDMGKEENLRSKTQVTQKLKAMEVWESFVFCAQD